MGTWSSLLSHNNGVINVTLAIFSAGWKLTRFVFMPLFFFLNTGIPCKNSQDCEKRFLCVNDLNNKHLYENNPVGQQMQKGEWSQWSVGGTGRHSHLQGSFGVGLYCKSRATFVFVFFFFTDMLPNRHNDQVLLHQTQAKRKRQTGIPADTTNIFILYPPIPPPTPAWLPNCPATRLVWMVPPSQMDLCHFGRCFTALIHCSNCFMLAHVGFTVKPASLDHFIRMQFRCLCSPIWASNMIKKLMMTQFSGLNA